MPFDALFVPPSLLEAVSDRAWLRAMLDAERALATAEAKAGVIPEEASVAIAAACDAGRFSTDELAREGRRAGNVVEPLVARLREVSEYAHWGATSQDVVDTAAMLVSHRARSLVLHELDGLAAACSRLAESHRSTVMAARTLLQQATPTTFGLKAAGWLVGVVDARHRLAGVQLEAQLGGASGTLAALGDRGLEVLRLFAEELSLAEPVLPWHASRGRIAELGATLNAVANACAKIALDIALLAQTEVREVREPHEGRSSTMPHKRNPVGSTLTRACAAGAHAAVDVLTGGVHEHERAAGAWHAEWKALSDALSLAGAAAGWMRVTVDGLDVDADRMRANLREETLSEAARFGEADRPEEYLGSADALIDRALAFYRG